MRPQAPKKTVFINDPSSVKWSIEVDHSVSTTADAGVCGTVLYSATLDGEEATKRLNKKKLGFSFEDMGDNDELKRYFRAKTNDEDLNKTSKQYRMKIELADWPTADFSDAHSV